MGFVNLTNFTFWADNNSETILDKQHILGVWSTSNKTGKYEYIESGANKSGISTTLWPTVYVILKKQSTSNNYFL